MERSSAAAVLAVVRSRWIVDFIQITFCGTLNDASGKTKYMFVSSPEPRFQG